MDDTENKFIDAIGPWLFAGIILAVGVRLWIGPLIAWLWLLHFLGFFDPCGLIGLECG